MFGEAAIGAFSLSPFSLSALSRSGVALFSTGSVSASSTGATGGRSSSDGGSATAVAVPEPLVMASLGRSAPGVLAALVLPFLLGLGIGQIWLNSIFAAGEINHGAWVTRPDY